MVCYTKPDVSKLLSSFVAEVKELVQMGFSYKNVKLTISRIVYICDIPAKAFIQGTKGHSGYDSCQYCRQHGKMEDGRVTFPDIEFDKRSDDLYAQGLESNQKAITPLLSIARFCSDFPVDPLHCVYLGVARCKMSAPL